MEKIAERFIRYARIDTQSDEKSTTCPSTTKQFMLIKALADELSDMGITKTDIDGNGYLFATIPANVNGDIPTIGFIAHIDVSPDAPSENVKPQIIKNYDGGDIMLNAERNIVLKVADSPELQNYVGQDIITTDGTTLLGADDKAGIAAIMQMAEYVVNNPDFKHGTIKIAFTPDEEIGRGADLFDVKRFGADFAYTIDGDGLGKVEFENFNAAYANISVTGKSVHPGSAKDKMVNASLLLSRIVGTVPISQTPRYTDGYEGFFHFFRIEGNVESATAELLIRDHDKNLFEQKKLWLLNTADALCKEYGGDYIKVKITDQYKNMREMIEPHMHIVDTAIEAIRQVGIEPIVQPIRGGTDGARLSFMGLPTPNLFAGGHNFHSRFEFLPINNMIKSMETMLKILELYTKKSAQ